MVVALATDVAETEAESLWAQAQKVATKAKHPTWGIIRVEEVPAMVGRALLVGLIVYLLGFPVVFFIVMRIQYAIEEMKPETKVQLAVLKRLAEAGIEPDISKYGLVSWIGTKQKLEKIIRQGGAANEKLSKVNALMEQCQELENNPLVVPVRLLKMQRAIFRRRLSDIISDKPHER